MIKPYHLLFAIFIGFAAGMLTIFYNEDPVNYSRDINKIQADLNWHKFKEIRYLDTLKREREDRKTLVIEVANLKTKVSQKEKRYAEVRKEIPKTKADTVKFLVQDTISCDSVVLALRDYSKTLEVVVKKDSIEINTLDSLVADLQFTKREQSKMDSLNVKELVKKGRKKFFKGLGIGSGAILLLKLLILAL